MSHERPTDLAERIRAEAETVESALVAFDRETLLSAGFDPDALVDHLLTDAFFEANTDFPTFAAFLEHAGVEEVWGFDGWLDWVLDWHVLGNTRFWSWEWLVHSAVALAADAARAGALRCGECGDAVTPTTGSAIEEPGRADAAWVEYRCGCGATGRAEIREPEGGVRLSGGVAWAGDGGLPAVREED